MNSVRERRKYIHTHIYIAHAWIRKSPPFIFSLFNEITVNPLHLVNRGGPPFLWRPSKFCLSPVFDAVRAPPFCGSVYTKDGMKNCRRDRMGRLLCFCVLLRMFSLLRWLVKKEGWIVFDLAKWLVAKRIKIVPTHDFGDRFPFREFIATKYLVGWIIANPAIHQL